ncbi:putative hydrolase C777.06c isoform X1 [Ricinus communis]|uniref:putative hydrolase C777.06c isoform X1 n=1 Tax=Ricinus communis TaxID=3988 RepID=UPI00201A7A29|nr:putative hydrolase C777.06c isoform X1 [Ricinus communis]XP_048226454.1 putative hydrolase C777.06c isoform X1 [Ricinus communis]
MESQNLTQNSIPDAVRSALIFLGTGNSNTVPHAICLIQPSDPPCHVCSQALSVPPEQNPNYRCNTSLLIDYYQSKEEHKYILIDVGKTFREQVLRWFTFHKIPRVDSIVLTHEHADAVLGLDDVRAVQGFSPTNDTDPIPVYLSQFSMDSVALRFPYLTKKRLREGEKKKRVAQLDWMIIEEDCQRPFVASGLQFVPLPVMHGKDYIYLGFLFGKKSRVAYISDVSRFPESTEYVISKAGAGQLDLLILEASRKSGGPGGAHFCLSQTLEALKRLYPKQALLTGMGHEFDHYKDNEFLAEWSKREGIPVQLAHDGLRIPIDL